MADSYHISESHIRDESLSLEGNIHIHRSNLIYIYRSTWRRVYLRPQHIDIDQDTDLDIENTFTSWNSPILSSAKMLRFFAQTDDIVIIYPTLLVVNIPCIIYPMRSSYISLEWLVLHTFMIKALLIAENMVCHPAWQFQWGYRENDNDPLKLWLLQQWQQIY